MNINKIFKAISNPRRAILFFIQSSNLFKNMDDEKYLTLIGKLTFGKQFNIRNPRTFCEKINWLKIHNRKPEYTIMVDKYAVKKYVADIIGQNYIIPTLGIWEHFDDINFDSLPQQFVLKTTHGGGSGGVVICKDKASFNIKSAKKKLEKSLQSDIYQSSREWPYKNVPKRIIAEKYLEPDNSQSNADLPDYKFFCFDGKPKFCQVIRERQSKETIDFYDMDWNHQEFVGLNPMASNGLQSIARPENLDEMKAICCKLSKGIPFLRVDLYVIGNKQYFGELTFYPASGFGEFTPKKWNETIGDLLTLNNTVGGENS